MAPTSPCVCRLVCSATMVALLGWIVSIPDGVACSPNPCREGMAWPTDGRVIPANAPALPFENSTDLVGAGSTGHSDPPVLLDAAGNVVPTTVPSVPADPYGPKLVPVAPLAPNTAYTLRRNELCELPAPVTVETGFTTAGEAVPPTETGTLQVLAHSRGDITVFTTAGMCTDTVDADHAELAVVPAASLVPWLAMVRLDVRVSGVHHGYTAYGALDAAGRIPLPRLHAACPPVPGGADTGLPEGLYRVEAVAQIAGWDLAPAAAAVDLRLSCAESNGCTAGRGSAGPAGFGWALLAVAVACLVRRRRVGGLGR